jgi:hypothetical protein
MFEAVALIPWLLIAGFWVFVIWAVFTLIQVLRSILAELMGISESLRAISGKGTVDRHDS